MSEACREGGREEYHSSRDCWEERKERDAGSLITGGVGGARVVEKGKVVGERRVWVGWCRRCRDRSWGPGGTSVNLMPVEDRESQTVRE